MPVIETQDLVKRYSGVTAVDHVTLAVEPGEVVAVLGPNGAGKTTTIEMLLGLRRPTSGTVRVLGGAPSDRAVRGRVGAMLQDCDSPDALTVREVVELVGSYGPRSLPVDEALARADLTGHARKRGGQLSGGQRQRLSLALALVGDPDLLYLDEPTASLDVAARAAFWEQVREFTGQGRTVLFSTHTLAEAEAFASRVVLFHRGRILQDGTPAQIRSLVAGSTVTLRTDADAVALRALPGVRSVAALPDGAWRLTTDAPEPVLAALFAARHQVAGLEVARATLEQAFLALTADTPDAPTRTGPAEASRVIGSTTAPEEPAA